MKFFHPLDHILDSSVKVRILRFLCRKGGEWSGRRLAAELKMNPVTAHRALRELYGATILDFRKTGNSFGYSLRDDHDVVRQVLRPLFERERGAHERLSELFRKELSASAKKSVLTAAIYGSIARGQERPTSDLDLLVLVPSEEAKRQVRPALDTFCEKVVSRFANVPSVQVNTVREAREKVRRGLPLFQSILGHHRLIWGRPLEEILRGRSA